MLQEIQDLRSRLAAAEETLRAIRADEVDALVVGEVGNQRIYTLKGSDEAYRTFVEVMSLGAATLSPDGTILYCNRWLSDRLGYPLEKTIGRPIFDLIDPTDEGLLRGVLWEGFTGGAVKRQFNMCAADGSIVPMMLTATPVKFADSANICLVVSDLTEHEARIAAEAAGRAKDRFLAILSHELRTPLTPVVMTSSSLANDPSLPEKARAGFAMIDRNIRLETKLIDDLLDLSRMAAGKLQLHLDNVALHSLIHSVLDMLQSDIREKSLLLSIELGASNCVVRGDSARLHQVLWNLVKNAVKFSNPNGSITIQTSNPDTSLVCIEVRDDGVGIDPAMLERIFNAFEQQDGGAGRKRGGLGLGLTIAKAICDLHGGSIRAESPGLGHGATFTLTLPVSIPAIPGGSRAADNNGGQPLQQSSSPYDLATDARIRPLRVLLVEDHEETSAVLSRLLRGIGHDVKTAQTVASALDLAGRQPFDLVISDIGLPDGSGHELMRRIRQTSAIPGIALTGYGMEDDVSRSHLAGFVEHIVKPVDVVDLQAVIIRATAASSPAPRP
jgi:PAS domain S-box-containing protein